jgi:hypothetical protein
MQLIGEENTDPKDNQHLFGNKVWNILIVISEKSI